MNCLMQGTSQDTIRPRGPQTDQSGNTIRDVPDSEVYRQTDDKTTQIVEGCFEGPWSPTVQKQWEEERRRKKAKVQADILHGVLGSSG